MPRPDPTAVPHPHPTPPIPQGNASAGPGPPRQPEHTTPLASPVTETVHVVTRQDLSVPWAAMDGQGVLHDGSNEPFFRMSAQGGDHTTVGVSAWAQRRSQTLRSSRGLRPGGPKDSSPRRVPWVEVGCGPQPQRGDRTRSSRNLAPLRCWNPFTLQPTAHAMGYPLSVLRTWTLHLRIQA